ncbi:hypothetical protein CR513_15570, partial [Mucuna pruriens]
MTIHEVGVDGKPWYRDIREYLKKDAYPLGATENDKRMLRRLAAGFFLGGVFLYKRSVDLTLLSCVEDQEAWEIMEEVHEGTFGTLIIMFFFIRLNAYQITKANYSIANPRCNRNTVIELRFWECNEVQNSENTYNIESKIQTQGLDSMIPSSTTIAMDDDDDSPLLARMLRFRSTRSRPLFILVQSAHTIRELLCLVPKGLHGFHLGRSAPRVVELLLMCSIFSLLSSVLDCVYTQHCMELVLPYLDRAFLLHLQNTTVMITRTFLACSEVEVMGRIDDPRGGEEQWGVSVTSMRAVPLLFDRILLPRLPPHLILTHTQDDSTAPRLPEGRVRMVFLASACSELQEKKGQFRLKGVTKVSLKKEDGESVSHHCCKAQFLTLADSVSSLWRFPLPIFTTYRLGPRGLVPFKQRQLLLGNEEIPSTGSSDSRIQQGIFSLLFGH